MTQKFPVGYHFPWSLDTELKLSLHVKFKILNFDVIHLHKCSLYFLVILQLLKDQKTDIKGFADFMQRLSRVKEHVPSLKEKVEYIKNLYEVKCIF